MLAKNFDDYGLISIMYHRFNENKYPSTNISMDLYKICYTKTEVKLALTFFKKQWKKGVNMFSKSGSKVKINYFEQISRKNILNMLGLS